MSVRRALSNWRRAPVGAVLVALALMGCSASTSSHGASTLGTTNDINPQPVAALRDGGNLRMSLAGFPANFNQLHVDGNDTDTASVVASVLPSANTSNAAGEVSVNPAYFTDIRLTNTSPQQVTYTINPKAIWSDGTPITWEDLKSEANALSGHDTSFRIAAPVGFDRVASVTRGVDDRQAIVTFDRPYAEWQQQFSPLYPRSVTSTAQAFDSLKDGLPVSAGPFTITKIDRTANRITLGRNPKWWGAKPRLETITFTVLDDSARLSALQNNELDYTGISGVAELTTANNTPGVVVRRAPSASFSHVTFNGAPGALLADAELRRAIAKAIDRQAVANALQHGVVNHPTTLNNHVFVAGQRGYQDNSGAIRFDLAQAARELDGLGWKLNGNVREKDGRKLELRDVMYQSDQWVNAATIIKEDMAKIGVTLNIQTIPGQGFFSDVVIPGNFDLAQFGWVGGPFPLDALDQIYSWDPKALKSNFARIGSPELNVLIERTLSELDPARAVVLANQCDAMIWDEAHSLPLVQSTGLIAQRANLANIGAFGLASVDWTAVGFLAQ